jgi:hypothetical protein
MPALSQNLEFVVNTTSTVSITYPNTATTMMVYNSNKAKGDGYYGSSDGLHTVMYELDSNFVGTVTMQATLASAPIDTDWFDVADTAQQYRNTDYRSTSTVNYFNFTGNFVWVRGQVKIADGVVQAVSYNH